MGKQVAAEGPFRTFIVFLIFGLESLLATCPKKFFNNSEKCVSCPEHCIFCNSTEYCHICDNGYSGADCSQLCANCKPGTRCAKVDGICEESCKDGLSGQYCDKQCGSRCGSCRRNDTTECLTCKNNLTCEPACPKDCYSLECKGNYSNCTNECLRGYWGEACENVCPESCKSDRPRTEGRPLSIFVPVLSVLLVTLVGVLFSVLVWKRRKCRKRRTSNGGKDYGMSFE